VEKIETPPMGEVGGVGGMVCVVAHKGGHKEVEGALCSQHQSVRDCVVGGALSPEKNGVQGKFATERVHPGDLLGMGLSGFEGRAGGYRREKK